jgi:hypothetical protein
MKIEIDFIDVTDDDWEQFVFRQEGSPGLKLPGCWLKEFVDALESPSTRTYGLRTARSSRRSSNLHSMHLCCRSPLSNVLS